MEDSGIFYGHSVNLPAIWYILRHFGIFCGHLVYFPRFGILYHEKSGNPAHLVTLSSPSRLYVHKDLLCSPLFFQWK
jgi:hypothetical protein